MGKLIVIEGSDGTGKATQSKKIISKLKRLGMRVRFLDFPQYGTPSCGPVEKYLNGTYGDTDSITAYQASLLYAVDRFDASFKLKKWLKEGAIVIANRYVTSNLAHQGCKIKNPKKRREFFKWVNNLEYNVFKIPRPVANLILYMPVELSHQLIGHKKSRKYLKGKKRDLHEANIRHLRCASDTYLELAKTYPREYKIINCYRRRLLSRNEIFELIWEKIKKII